MAPKKRQPVKRERSPPATEIKSEPIDEPPRLRAPRAAAQTNVAAAAPLAASPPPASQAPSVRIAQLLQQVSALRQTVAARQAAATATPAAAALNASAALPSLVIAPRLAPPRVVWPAFAACTKCTWRGHSDVLPHHMQTMHAAAASAPTTSSASGIPDELECAICIDVLDNAMLVVSCGHSFCAPCLDSHFNAQDRKTCPKCRGDANETVIDARSRRLCAALTVDCTQDGCKWKGRQDERAAHLVTHRKKAIQPKPPSAPPPERSASLARRELLRLLGYDLGDFSDEDDDDSSDESSDDEPPEAAVVPCIVTRAIAERGFCFLQSPTLDGRIFLHVSVCEKCGVAFPGVGDQLSAFVEQAAQGLRVTKVWD